MTIVDPNGIVTTQILGEAVDILLKGMDNILEEQKKIFATKEDLKQFATKDDLNREISWVRDDIKGLTAELADTISKKEFNKLKAKVDKYITT